MSLAVELTLSLSAQQESRFGTGQTVGCRVNHAWLMIDLDVSIKTEWSRTFPKCFSYFYLILPLKLLFCSLLFVEIKRGRSLGNRNHQDTCTFEMETKSFNLTKKKQPKRNFGWFEFNMKFRPTLLVVLFGAERLRRRSLPTERVDSQVPPLCPGRVVCTTSRSPWI